MSRFEIKKAFRLPSLIPLIVVVGLLGFATTGDAAVVHQETIAANSGGLSASSITVNSVGIGTDQLYIAAVALYETGVNDTGSMSLSLTSSLNNSILFVASHPRNNTLSVEDAAYTQRAAIPGNTNGGAGANLSGLTCSEKGEVCR